MIAEQEFVTSRFDPDEEVVFCHNDCWWSNQVINEEKGKNTNEWQGYFRHNAIKLPNKCCVLSQLTDRISLIDFDLADYNYYSADFAEYFVIGKHISNSLLRKAGVK